MTYTLAEIREMLSECEQNEWAAVERLLPKFREATSQLLDQLEEAKKAFEIMSREVALNTSQQRESAYLESLEISNEMLEKLK